jgi:N4-gp56 family major capsid protein
MAFAGTPSTTGAAILGNAVTSFYQKTMLEWMRPTFRFYAFATKKPLPANAGTSITWNRKVALGYGYTLSQGVPICAVKTISTNRVSALVEQLGDSVLVSDYARLSTVINTDAYAIELMADQAASTVEQYIIQNLMSDLNVTHFVKNDAGLKEGWAGTVICAGGAARLALSDIRRAVTRLQSNNAAPYDGTSYVAIIHPVQLQDLYADTTFTSWSQYQVPEKMFDYEVGKVFNCRVMTSTSVPIAPGSTLSGDSMSTATGSAWKAYGMAVLGRDFYGVTELDGGIQTFKSSGASKSDPNNLTDVYAWKANIAAKVLNPSAGLFVWSSDGTQVNAGTTYTTGSAITALLGFNTLFPAGGTSAQLTGTAITQFFGSNNFFTAW